MFAIGGFHLTGEEVRRRKDYLELRPEDESRLREVHPTLLRMSAPIIDRFYDYLLRHEHTRHMLSVPGLVERLKGLQARYFSELTAGTYDLAYFENRLRVGQAHERVGLSPEWYLGAYNEYLRIVGEVLSKELPVDAYLRTVTALTKVVHLDMSLALDAYIFAAQERLERKGAALEEANAQLRKLTQAKQQLTDMIVHDLQNPLAGITAFLQVLKGREGGMSEGDRDALDEALQRCGDLSQMILNVLHVSRAEAGRLETYIEEVDLAALARETCTAFQLVAEKDGRSLSVEAEGTVPVRTDQTLMRRVLGNLVRNALRHTPRGTRVVIVAERTAGRARLRVIDDGPGIPPELHAMLFVPFGAPALREAGRRVDSGLGLAFVKAAADAVGAKLTVESDGRKGTAFSLSLP